MSILNKLHHKKIRTDIEEVDIYRLGIFENNMFELVELNANQYYPPHIHRKANAKFYIIIGEGTIMIGSKEKDYGAGDVFIISKGTSHGFKVKKQTLFLSIQNPPIIDKRGNIDVQYVGGKK